MPDRGETAAQRLSADGVIALGRRLRRGRWRFGQAKQWYPRIESEIEDVNARSGPRAAATTAIKAITRRARVEQLKAHARRVMALMAVVAAALGPDRAF